MAGCRPEILTLAEITNCTEIIFGFNEASDFLLHFLYC
jgi:hypothetical protein